MLEAPRPELCGLRDISLGGPSRERTHQTEPPPDWSSPPLFCTCGFRHGQWTREWDGGPKEFSEAPYTCSPTQGRVEA